MDEDAKDFKDVKDELTRLPTQRDRDIGDLLRHRWEPTRRSPGGRERSI